MECGRAELAAAVAALDPSDPRPARAARLPLLLKELSHPVGAFRYSNVGYTLAGAVLERAANRSFETLLTDSLFRPLGMTSAAFGTPVGSNLPDLIRPSGGVAMTVPDWAKFLRMQLGEPVNGVRLLSADSPQKLHTPDPLPVTDESGTFRYGFGWRTADTPLGEALGHEGAVPGYYSRVGLIPALQVAVFSAANDPSDPGSAASWATGSMADARARSPLEPILTPTPRDLA